MNPFSKNYQSQLDLSDIKADTKMSEVRAKPSPQRIGESADYWGNLAQQKADADARRGVSQPVSYYTSSIVGALLATYPALSQQPAQVQGEPLAWVEHHKGGDNLVWDEPGGRKSPLYTTPQPAQATQAEVTDAEIEALFGKCGGHWSGDQWVIEDADLHPFARAILALRPEQSGLTGCNCRWNGDTQVQWCELHLAHKDAIHEWAERAKEAEKQLALRPERVPMTPREIELIDGMIAVQLDHAQRCDAISNRAMAEKQKGWDMERVELLRRIRSFGSTAQAKKEGV